MGDVHVIVEQVRSATVVVTSGPPGVGEPVGTGFFVAPGRIVTCAHVVEEAGPNLHVRWAGGNVPALVHKATPRPAPGQERTEGDAAVLHVAERDHPCVPLAPRSANVRDEVWAYGVTKARRGTSRPPELDGSLLTVTAIPNPGAPDGGPNLTLKGRITQGMSGGPLLDLTSFGVTGVVQSRMPDPAEGGWAVAIEDALALGSPDDLRRLNPKMDTSLERLRSAQLALGRLPEWVRTDLTPTAAERLKLYLTGPPSNREAPPLPNDDDRREWVARQLFTLSLAGLAGALDQVADLLGPRTTGALYEMVASCLPVATSSPWWWIAGDAAATLRSEMDLPTPRLVHVSTAEDRTVRLLVRRAYEGTKVTVERCVGAAGASTSPSGLQQENEDDLREEIKRLAGGYDDGFTFGPVEAEELRQMGVFLQIDLGDAPDAVQLRRLVDQFPGARFLLCRRGLTLPPESDDVLLALRPEIDPTNEKKALARLDQFTRRLGEAP